MIESSFFTFKALTDDENLITLFTDLPPDSVRKVDVHLSLM